MPITISQQDYWGLVREAQLKKNLNHSDKFDATWQYPEELGQGTYQEIRLMPGIILDITRYHLHDRLIVRSPERSHEIEFNFAIAGKSAHVGKFLHNHSTVAGQYELFGSGIAPIEIWESSPTEPFMAVGVHVKPELLQDFLGDCELASTELEHLIKESDRYYSCIGTTTVAMQTVLHQILHCPYVGITKKIYLESKVWELMALLVEEELERHHSKHLTSILKSEDIDRIRNAKEILTQQIDHPPLLLDLARQVGLNDCTLKRGFREVFGTTAFGYLHDYRLEQARLMLLENSFSVSMIAERVGFSSCSSLSRAFRKKYGVTPKQYQVQFRNSV